MPIRIETGLKNHLIDPAGHKWMSRLEKQFPRPVEDIRVLRTYIIDDDIPLETLDLFCKSALCDPVTSEYCINGHLPADFDYLVEVDFKPGVTDNEGRTATEALAILMNIGINECPHVYSGYQYRIKGKLDISDIHTLAVEFFANTLIQRIRIASRDEFKNSKSITANPPVVNLNHTPVLAPIDLNVSDEQLAWLSRKNVWALSVNELTLIRDHFQRPDIIEVRKSLGLPDNPLDIEIECLAQTWSEHCKHKIFNAIIEYTEDGKKDTINSVFKTYIRGATEAARKNLGEHDFCLSVFKDNAGVIKFNEDYGLVFKVETHNSPSALDPYGGALTGIVGVNRDPFGTGMGGELLFNTNVFCLANPFMTEEVPAGLLHPMRILEGVREGVEHGGNQSGIPTVNGSVVFDDRYMGKPLVYCGTGGIVPIKLHGRDGFEKYPEKGHLIVMCGGRVGMDGIHGATFSSEELHEESPSSAVQIGDPITQKRMFDFLIRARDAGLYSGITDNGAGGLSSSVGEMAQFTGGATIDLAKVPLKYEGLDPWEILVSESQERMTVAVCPDKIDAFLKLSESMAVESTVIGEFTSNGFLEFYYDEKVAGLLEMDFLHNGLPPMHLTAEWTTPERTPGDFSNIPSHGEILHRLLKRLNIASKEYWVRQYDHEVKGTSVIKPLMGIKNDGPSDAAVIRPFLDSMEAVCISNGIIPRYSDIDAWDMTLNSFDEAVRNAVSVGGNPDSFAALDNFCWPDPLPGADNHKAKLGSLVRSGKALLEICSSWAIPLISGKDSMKNDARVDNRVISVPPTLLISIVGKLRADQAISMDFKSAGDLIYIIGVTRPEHGQSEFSLEFKTGDTRIPQVNTKEFIKYYRQLHRAIVAGTVRSCHDISDGGLAVALAEKAIAGRCGCEIDINRVPCIELLSPLDALYSETPGRFVVTVSAEKSDEFEHFFKEQSIYSRVGFVTDSNKLIINSGETCLLQENVHDLFMSWHKPLDIK